ncbi:MAG: FBP domain-containing protein [Cellulosilyticaceae bacterium]
MEPFISKENANFINKQLFHLTGTFKSCIDKNIIETCKLSIQEEILSLFPELSTEQKDVLTIVGLQDPLAIDTFKQHLDVYVYGIPTLTSSHLTKLFKKEKKLKLPTQNAQAQPLVYLGWIDESTRKLFIVRPVNGKLLGMVCRLPNTNSKNTHICTLCHHVGDDTEVAFVSAVCKTPSPDAGTYRSIGFDICLDSQKCNERITSTEKLEALLKNVCQIKGL